MRHSGAGPKSRLATLFLLLTLGLAAPAAAQFSDSYNFLKAVKERDVLKAKSFMDKPGSTVVNTRDLDDGETALLIAVRRRDTPWMGFLLQNGADPNLADRQGNTPLIVAASSNFSDGVRLMLAGKARVDVPNSRGETPLIKAVHNRDAASVQLLLSAGADPDRTDNLAGMSARDYAARDTRAGTVGKLLAEAPKKSESKSVGPKL
jgi:ankyrin repeat protein